MTNSSVPFLDLVTPHRELEAELLEAVRKALRGAQFIGGAEVDAFEQEFAAYCGAKHCIGVASGTDALRFALIASGVGDGDAVITVAHTFIATIEAISQSGASTEFVDIDPQTYNLSPSALDAYLAACPRDADGRVLGLRTGKPIRAVVPVHLYGQMADMDRISEIASRYGLMVIEDACQAHGAEYHSADGVWRRAGSIGKAAGFSFYPGKNLGACGEGGAVTTNDDEVARVVRMLRDHGQIRKYYHDLEGYNGRLDAIQAAILRIKLRHLDKWTMERRAAAARYRTLFTDPATRPAAVTVPFEPEFSKAVYHLYVVRSSGRDELAERLKANGVQSGFHYPMPVHLQNCYRSWGYRQGSLPETEKAASEIISLPMFPGLTPEQQKQVAAAVRSFAPSEEAVASAR